MRYTAITKRFGIWRRSPTPALRCLLAALLLSATGCQTVQTADVMGLRVAIKVPSHQSAGLTLTDQRQIRDASSRKIVNMGSELDYFEDACFDPSPYSLVFSALSAPGILPRPESVDLVMFDSGLLTYGGRSGSQPGAPIFIASGAPIGVSIVGNLIGHLALRGTGALIEGTPKQTVFTNIMVRIRDRPIVVRANADISMAFQVATQLDETVRSALEKLAREVAAAAAQMP